ncbi:hypothetical protein BC936DRAFT_137209 [Jimgerdemannia flammicorona]|uniref:Uncharacterized protein n=1 Tax=Jimgerdemannia flammicorona TaxID=994334 RepID=A0A433DJ59_9FUNG|nr:hypothetical protein BC936DRAFT_137209 [Jimgerdemannia flammicorona]
MIYINAHGNAIYQIYRFVPQVFYDSLPSERTPEILRTPLNALLLRCIDARLGDPRAILARCIDPPEDATVDVALDDLVTIGAVIKRKVAVEFEEDDDDDDDDVWVRTNEFVFEYEVTMLGRVLARLPLDLHAGLLVVYGALFGQLREAIIMAGMKGALFFKIAVLQNKGVIVQPPGLEISISATLKRFHIDLPDDQPLRGGADLISQLRAYLYWEETTQFEHSFDLAHELQWCQEQNLSLYWIREVQDLVLTVRESLAKHSICAAPTKAERDRIRRNRVVKVRPAMLEVGIDNEEGIKQLETNEEDIKQPEINEEGTKQSETGTGEDANKRADVQTAYFTEYDTTDIEDAIKVLDTAAAENNAMSNTPVSSEIGDTIPHPIDTIGFTRSLTKRSIDLDEPFAPGESPPNPWVNIFDRAHNITAQAVQLQREPNALLLTLLLTAAFHDNMLRVSPTDASSFRNCPTEYNRAHTIEFTARQLPPKGVMIETLQREVGLISRIDHTENTSIDDVCYVEFIKPAKPIWNHSRDGGELPDAVYIAQKMKTTRNSNWDTLAEYPESTAQLRFSTISSDPDTATKLSPMFHSNQSRAFLSRFSLFFPIISPKRDQDRYTVSAARLLAVERGRSWVADYVTCLINPTPYEGIGIGQDMKPDYGNTGDLIIALFGNDVDMTGGWSIGVGGQTYPLFYDVPPKSVQRVLAAVRVYLRHALFERLPLLPEIADEEYREVNIAAIQSMARVARAWEMKLRPEVAGDLLVKTILMCL